MAMPCAIKGIDESGKSLDFKPAAVVLTRESGQHEVAPHPKAHCRQDICADALLPQRLHWA